MPSRRGAARPAVHADRGWWPPTRREQGPVVVRVPAPPQPRAAPGGASGGVRRSPSPALPRRPLRGGDSQGGGSCAPRVARMGRAGGADCRPTGGRVSGHRGADLAEARHSWRVSLAGRGRLVDVRRVEDLVVGGEAARGPLALDPAEVAVLLQLPQGGGHTVAPFGPESGELAYRGPAAVREPEEVREDAHRRPRKVLVARRGVGETGERALGRATVNAHSGRSGASWCHDGRERQLPCTSAPVCCAPGAFPMSGHMRRSAATLCAAKRAKASPNRHFGPAQSDIHSPE